MIRVRTIDISVIDTRISEEKRIRLARRIARHLKMRSSDYIILSCSSVPIGSEIVYVTDTNRFVIILEEETLLREFILLDLEEAIGEQDLIIKAEFYATLSRKVFEIEGVNSLLAIFECDE